MTTATLTPTVSPATADLLALARRPETCLEDVIAALNCVPNFAAGLIDAVEGNGYWMDCIAACEPNEADRDDYEAGFLLGTRLVEEERYGEGWEEAYRQAEHEARQAAALLPVCDDDLPF